MGMDGGWVRNHKVAKSVREEGIHVPGEIHHSTNSDLQSRTRPSLHGLSPTFIWPACHSVTDHSMKQLLLTLVPDALCKVEDL
jgi:hypothetical protein